MLKRLKSLWFGKKAVDAEDLDEDGSDAEGSSDEVTEVDPLEAALAEFDARVSEAGPEAAMPELRALLLETPTEPRLLARAAELLRDLDDPELAELFDDVARGGAGGALAALSRAFTAMADPELGEAFADGALASAPTSVDALLAMTCALAGQSRHEEVLDLARPARTTAALQDTPEGRALALRYGLSALTLGELGAYAEVAHVLNDAAPWLGQAALRVEHFGPRAAEEGARQHALFSLYGAILLDDLRDGEAVDAARLGRWVEAIARIIAPTPSDGLESEPALRPTWISPRGEVLARWIAHAMPDRPNPIPLSARIPGQDVLVVIVDDGELAQLWETRAFFDAPAPVFQAIKDPAEVGSPVADFIGILRAEVTLPFDALEADKLADRLAPKQLFQALLDEAGAHRQDALAPLLQWVDARRGYLLCDQRLPPEARPPFGSEGI